MIFDFVDGGADAEGTVRANLAAFERIRFSPRVLVDVSQCELTTTIFGQKVSMPVLLGPTGLVQLITPEGEVAAARAAAKAGTIYVAPIAGSRSVEEIADAANGATLWFQLYLWRQRKVVEHIVHRAVDTGGYHALCVTVDVPVNGFRERDRRNGMTMPPRVSGRNALETLLHPRWLYNFIRQPTITMKNLEGLALAQGDNAVALGTYMQTKLRYPEATWEDIQWLRTLWPGPLVVKGILSPEDAKAAVDVGADGVVVSNHGGRQLDGMPPTIDVLPRIAEVVRGDREVFLDSGIRSGQDVVKSLALGARACLVGRPYLWGLAVAGEGGASDVLEILRRQIAVTLALVGVPNVNDLDSTTVYADTWT